MEMLEFLASFEDEDTGWIDPQDLMNTDKLQEEEIDHDATQEKHDGQ